MADDRVGDAPHEGTSEPAESPAAHHYQADAELIGQVHDRHIFPLVHPEMSPRNGPSGLLDFSQLLIKYVLSILLDRFERFLVGFPTEAQLVRAVGRVRPSRSSGDDV